eukprot:208517_1
MEPTTCSSTDCEANHTRSIGEWTAIHTHSSNMCIWCDSDWTCDVIATLNCVDNIRCQQIDLFNLVPFFVQFCRSNGRRNDWSNLWQCEHMRNTQHWLSLLDPLVWIIIAIICFRKQKPKIKNETQTDVQIKIGANEEADTNGLNLKKHIKERERWKAIKEAVLAIQDAMDDAVFDTLLVKPSIAQCITNHDIL